MSDTDLAGCTIVSKNYLAYARTLTESFHRQHPGRPFFVLLVDRVDGYFAPARESFQMIGIGELDIPDLPRFCFQYSILELNTATKPFFLRHLLTRHGVRKLVYLDPDILVYRPLAELASLLDQHSIVLVPHFSAPMPDDGRKPTEQDIMEAGTYNLGFIAVRDDATVAAFLEWWGDRVYDGCLLDPRRGLFVDQRWIDLAPGLFPGIHIERHPGYNVAYWNLPQRAVGVEGGELTANGRPLYFFHFSGVDPQQIERVSKYQNRYTLKDLPALRPVFEDYRTRLLAHGYGETRSWPYAFAGFENGVRIPAPARRLYWSLGEGARRFGDPFLTRRAGTFWQWLTDEVYPGAGVSRLWYHVYVEDGEIQTVFPDLFGADRRGFHRWARTRGQILFDVDGAFGPSVDVDQATPPVAAGPARHLDRGMNVAGYAMSEKGVGEALRATVRALTAAAVPHCVIDFPDTGSVNRERALVGLVKHNPYPVNLIHVNADQIPHFVEQRGRRFLRGKYNIGFWMWELSDFPESFRGAFEYLDEVWVASGFCLDAISRVSPVPVVKVPLALSADGLAAEPLGRERFGLPPDPTVFLFMFDVHSVVERKNPFGLLRAFRRAFPGREDVRLVLKLVHGDAEIRQRLVSEAADARVVVIDRVMTRSELTALMSVSDCYVSLHRSEGFGLTMAEAMALGKPVIATAYSANLDFMTPANSFLVRYDVVKLRGDYGLYGRGSVWADPDPDHAAELMRFVYEKPDAAATVGRRAASDIREYLSPQSVGARIAERLGLITDRLTSGGVRS